MRLDDIKVVIIKSSISGKYIFCREIGNLVESDELGEKHGKFATRKAAIAAARDHHAVMAAR